MTHWDELRKAINAGELQALRVILEKDPGLPRQTLSWGQNCRIGPCQPLSYVAQARFNGFVQHDLTGKIASILIAAGAPVNGATTDRETPLITAASYDEAEVARVLIEAGAELEETGHALPEGTALAHAVEFGAPEVVDLLIAAGARICSLPEAAGTGDLRGMLHPDATESEKTLALRAAAVCNRLDVVDQLLAAGVSVDAMVNGGTCLHWAAWGSQGLGCPSPCCARCKGQPTRSAVQPDSPGVGAASRKRSPACASIGPSRRHQLSRGVRIRCASQMMVRVKR